MILLKSDKNFSKGSLHSLHTCECDTQQHPFSGHTDRKIWSWVRIKPVQKSRNLTGMSWVKGTFTGWSQAEKTPWRKSFCHQFGSMERHCYILRWHDGFHIRRQQIAIKEMMVCMCLSVSDTWMHPQIVWSLCHLPVLGRRVWVCYSCSTWPTTSWQTSVCPSWWDIHTCASCILQTTSYRHFLQGKQMQTLIVSDM